MLQQIFGYLVIIQRRIKISFWNFQHLFIMRLCKIDTKILTITQSACPPRPISAKTLNASRDRICWDILKRKKTGVVLDQFQLPIWRNFEFFEKNGVFQFFWKLACPSYLGSPRLMLKYFDLKMFYLNHVNLSVIICLCWSVYLIYFNSLNHN